MTDMTSDVKIRDKFNEWAETGRGEEMEEHHLPIAAPALSMMDLKPDDRVLDLGCGSGWLSRRIAHMVSKGRVVGIDLAPEMVRHARSASKELTNLSFLEGAADGIPFADRSFTKIISVESAYYWPDAAGSVLEMFRVLAGGGSAWIVINYYRDNPHAHQWGSLMNVTMHLFSAEEWMSFYSDAGFVDVQQARIPDPTPVPDNYTGRWFRDSEQMRRFQQEGALLVRGMRPA